MKRVKEKILESRQGLFLSMMFLMGAVVLVGCGGQRVSKGWRALRRGDLEGARVHAEKGLKKDPDSEKLWDLKLRVDLLSQDWEAAAKSYQKLSPMVYQREELASRRLLVAQSLWGGLKERELTIRRHSARLAHELGVTMLEIALKKAANDPDPLVRVYANAALLPRDFDGWLGLMKLSRNGDPKVRQKVAAVSKKVVGRGYVGKVLVRLAKDQDPEVRAAALRSLAEVQKSKKDRFRKALGLLLQALKDPSGVVRSEAASRLAKIKGNVGVEWVRETLKDPELAVRLAGLRGMKKKKSAKELQSLLSGPDLYLALRAAVALSKRGHQKGVGEALDRAMGSSEWSVRAAAINAASSIKRCPSASKVASKGLGDKHPRVRLAAVRACLHRGWSKEEAKKVAETLMERGDKVGVGACEVLAKKGNKRALKRLGLLAVVGLSETRIGAVLALGRVSKGKDKVLQSWAKGPWKVRLVAAQALWGWKSR